MFKHNSKSYKAASTRRKCVRMPMNVLDEITRNRFLLILMEEDEYLQKLSDIIKSVEETKTKICYVCLSKPYIDVIEDLRGSGIDVADFFFIDVLTSHYSKPEAADNCIFVQEPTELTGIRVAIRKAIQEEKCSVILFDTISTMLIYQETHSIVKFTHSLLAEKENESIKELFIVLKGETGFSEENQKLVSDLTMFADKTLDLSREGRNVNKE
jgi:hypothetical protein